MLWYKNRAQMGLAHVDQDDSEGTPAAREKGAGVRQACRPTAGVAVPEDLLTPSGASPHWFEDSEMPRIRVKGGLDVCYESPAPLKGEMGDTQCPQPEESRMTNQKQEAHVVKRPTEVDEEWFNRIRRAKTAREQAQKAREGRPPVNPLSRTPLPLNHD